MVVFSYHHPSTSSTFTLSMFRAEKQVRGEVGFEDGLEGCDDAFFADDGVGAADAAEEVGVQFADVEVGGHEI